MTTYEQIPSLSPYLDEAETTDVDVFSLPMDLSALLNPLAIPPSPSTLSLSTIRTLIADQHPNLINRYCSCQVRRPSTSFIARDENFVPLVEHAGIQRTVVVDRDPSDLCAFASHVWKCFCLRSHPRSSVSNETAARQSTK